MASTPGFEPGPHWWEASALTTAPPLLPRRTLGRAHICYFHQVSSTITSGRGVFGTALKFFQVGTRSDWLAKVSGLGSKQLMTRTRMAIVSIGTVVLKASTKISSISGLSLIAFKTSNTSSAWGGSFTNRSLLSRQRRKCHRIHEVLDLFDELLRENSSLIRANVVPFIFEGAGHYADVGARQPLALAVP